MYCKRDRVAHNVVLIYGWEIRTLNYWTLCFFILFSVLFKYKFLRVRQCDCVGLHINLFLRRV